MSSSTPTLTIRFSSSLPDICIPLTTDPHALSPASLKQQIRARLPPEHNALGIRLIAGGRVLDGAPSVGDALRIPRRQASQGGGGASNDAHPGGSSTKPTQKQPAPTPPPTPQIFYIHAALSPTPLSAAELAQEAALAQRPSSPPPNRTTTTNTNTPSDADTDTRPPALGFDRLAGFSPADIASLRAQFRAQVVARHTPADMPSERGLRLLEERWLDAGGGAGGGGQGASDVTAPGVGDEDDNAAGLDDALWGAVMGFFWPLGALAWGLREEGVWSRRRQLGVLVGVVVNFGFGALKALN